MFEDDNSLGGPIKARRRCTDFGSALCALIDLVLLAVLVAYAEANKNHRLYDRKGTAFPHSLVDFSGRACGEAVHAQEPFVFFCQRQDDGTLDYEHPVCRSSCPATSTQSSCPVELNGTMRFEPVADYASVPVAGVLCMPTDPQLVEDRLFEVIGELAQKSTSRSWILEVSVVSRAWTVIAVSAALSLLLGMAYLRLLRTSATIVVEIGFILTVAGPALLGMAFIHSSQWDHGFCPSSADRCLGSGLGLMLVSALAACLAVFLHRDIACAAECLEAAERCVRDVPQLLWEPLAAAGVKAAISCLMVLVLLSLLSCGRIRVDPITDKASFHHDPLDWLAIAFAAASLAWLLELSTALSDFAVSFAVQCWFFSPAASRSEPLVTRGYSTALQYHLGTLALGSFIIPLVRLPRVAVARQDGCRQGAVHRMHRRVYMDTAATGRPFHDASQTACSLMRRELPAGLEGAMFASKVAGMGAIVSAAFASAYVLSRSWPRHSDPASEQFVQDPAFLSAASAAAGFVVALPFVQVLDQVVDTIAYCIAKEREATQLQAAAAFHATPAIGLQKGFGRNHVKEVCVPHFAFRVETEAEAARATPASALKEDASRTRDLEAVLQRALELRKCGRTL